MRYNVRKLKPCLDTPKTAFPRAVEGCTGIMHMASPFPDLITTTVTEEELLKPAKEGTLVVLKAAAAHTATVKRVVVTSSFAAVHGKLLCASNVVY